MRVPEQRFSNLFNAYNKKYDRNWSLVQRSFKRKPITYDANIHNNPVHLNFVRDPQDWPHSSWHAYLSDRAIKLEKQEEFDWFGRRICAPALPNESQGCDR